MLVFYAAGDPGGSRAVLPVLKELDLRGARSAVLDHGFLGHELPLNMRGSLCKEDDARSVIASSDAFVFGSSVQDCLPLQLARYARSLNIPIVHICDNWGSYGARLSMDGCPMLDVDVYAVMDDEAKCAAMVAGIAEERLFVSGHPAFSDVAAVLKNVDSSAIEELKKRYGLPADKACVAFVNEPFSKVFGGLEQAREGLGFNEQDVFTEFCKALAPLTDELYLLLLPHPKQTDEEMDFLWAHSASGIPGKVLRPRYGREILPALSGLAGMSSALLYEAWLGGLPVLSMRPGAKNPHRFLTLSGMWNVENVSDFQAAVGAWGRQCLKRVSLPAPPELDLHAGAVTKLADMIQKLAGQA